MVLEEGVIFARFDFIDIQLRVREVLMGVMGDKYVVAFNFVSVTSRWLVVIYVESMKFGFDLRGGVYFLMEVDMDIAFGKFQE